MISAKIHVEFKQPEKSSSRQDLYAYGMTLVEKANWMRSSVGKEPIDLYKEPDPVNAVTHLLEDYVTTMKYSPGQDAQNEVQFWAPVVDAYRNLTDDERNRVNRIYTRTPDLDTVHVVDGRYV